MLVLSVSDSTPRTERGTKPRAAQVVTKIFLCLIVCVWQGAGLAADSSKPDQALETRIQGVIPDLEQYIASG
jgi:hypothetical protein